MDHVEILAQIRCLVREKLNQFGSSAESLPSEVMLIRDGYFCGRRFRCDGLVAVWFVEERQIKFYDREGSILEVLQVDPATLNTVSAPRRAA